MSVVAAVERDLESIRRVDPVLAGSALAATALVLAGELDDAENSATSKSMCARALREAMDRLRELAPAAAELDRVDELSSRRGKRRAAS